QREVERAIGHLPQVTLVTQAEIPEYRAPEGWSPDDEDEEETQEEAGQPAMSYVPIDPCQGVIAALRIALEERIPRAFIDLETADFLTSSASLPDPYALKVLSPDQFAAGILPLIPRPVLPQRKARIVAMANRLRELEQRFQSILCVCSIMDWPWIKE